MASGGEESRIQKIRMVCNENKAIEVQLIKVYEDSGIPVWTRTALSSFIEGTCWPDDADADKNQDLYNKFICQANLNGFGQPEGLEKMKASYPEDCAGDFVRAMRRCIQTEISIIEGQTIFEPEEPDKVLTEAWENLKSIVKDHLAQSEKRSGQKRRRGDQGNNNLSELVRDAVNNIQTAGGWVVDNLKLCSKSCFDDLSRWYKEKNLIKYKKIEGADHKLMHLEQVQERFRETHEKCIKTAKMVSDVKLLTEGLIKSKKMTDMPEEMCNLESILGEMNVIQTTLEERSIVIEEQPDQIIEIKDHSTKNKETFKIKLRSMLSLRVEDAKLKLVNQDDLDSQRTSKAEVLHKPPIKNGDRVVLSEIKIKNFHRPINQNVLFVPYAFQLTIKIANHEKKIQMYSHDCILGSHTQLSKAQGYLLWSSAFSTQEFDLSEPFQVREEVPWNEFHPVLSDYFNKEVNYIFTRDNVDCLSEMFDNATVSWKKLVIEPSPNCPKKQKEKNFTIWDWLCGAKNILKEFPGLCRERLIHGFITKDRADELLKEEQEGSFLLRFSHTFLDGKTNPTGGLSVVVNTHNRKKGKVEVLHSAPFSLKSDKVDRLPKEGTFGLWLLQFITKSNENTDVGLKQLCGTCKPLEDTFKFFMLQSPSPAWHDYQCVTKKLVMDNRSNTTVVNMETEQGNVLQEKIKELVNMARVQPGFDVKLIAPTPADPLWKMVYMDDSPSMMSPAVSTDCADYDNTLSPGSTSLMSPSSASGYHSAVEDQMDVELDMQEECVRESSELAVLCDSLQSILNHPNGEMEGGPVLPVTESNSEILRDYFATPAANSVCEPLHSMVDSYNLSWQLDLNTPPACIPEPVIMFQLKE